MAYQANAQLAKDYHWVAANTGAALHFIRPHLRRIADADVDIRVFYAQNGNSLAKLDVKGIGRFMKLTLESIIAVGREETAEKFNGNFNENLNSVWASDKLAPNWRRGKSGYD